MATRLDTPATASTTLTFNTNKPSSCTFSNLSSPFHLLPNQTLAITFTGFPSNSTFDFLAIRLNDDPTEVQFFPASAGTSTLTGVFTVTASGPNGPPPSPIPTDGLVINIKNTQSTSTRQHYSCNLHGTQGGTRTKWKADPEVINRIGTGGQDDEETAGGYTGRAEVAYAGASPRRA